MATQIERAQILKRLHIKGNPLVLVNIWDAGSALAVQESGAAVIATGSWAVAASHGYEDGEKLPFNLALKNLKRIIACVDCPVTFDVEAGYGKSPVDIQEIITKVIQAGVAGINIEDKISNSHSLYSIKEQCDRISAIRMVANNLSVPLFINARTDIIFKQEADLKDAIERLDNYKKAGADGFFAPWLKKYEYIEKLCQYSDMPINIMMSPDLDSVEHLAKLGVSRISYGPMLYGQTMNTIRKFMIG